VPCRRLAAVGLVVLAWMAAPVWVFGVRAASAAQVIYSARAQVRNPTKTPSRTPAHAPAANNAPPAKSAPAAKTPPAKGPARAPSKPPLGTGSGAAGLTPEEEASASASPSGGDPFVDNGGGSPLCGKGTRAELLPAGQRNCRSSDFEAAAAPTGNYAFDVHINSGLADAGNYLSVAVQDVAQWGWMLLVAIVHGVIVMLEWSYTVDLLKSSAMGEVTKALSETQAAFTRPWLVLALAVAAVLALYHGIVRRQVSETLGQVVLMGVMMLVGFWVIVNPLGTVGALGAWANEAGLGTLGAVVAGTPDTPDRTLAESMESVFSGTIGGPWCYMEFGNVRWCEDPVNPKSRLDKTALEIATKERAAIGSQSTELLRDAKTNGDLFLALPANGEQRNSINEYGPFKNQVGLFNVLCGGSEEPCHGPTAGEAEFRTQHGTAARVIGLFLIWIGVLGMVLLLGYLALHLLGAAIASLFLLLLAPAAVIAPALGDGGRSLFRRWGAWLLGAVCSKLIFSFLLGVVLLMQQTLMKLTMFGWWAQWLLVSAMWWGAFCKRRQVLGFAHGTRAGSRQHGIGGLRLASRLMAARELGRVGSRVARKLSPGPPNAEKRQRIAAAGNKRAEAIADRQVSTSLERSYHDAQEQLLAEPQMRARQAGRREKLQDLKTKQASAQRRGHQGRADRVGRAARRVEKDIQLEERKHQLARHTVTEGDKAKRQSGNLYTAAQHKERAQFLDTQAALPRRRRDYASLAGVIGHSPDEWKQLNPQARTKARDAIDRELATRGQLAGAVDDVVSRKEPSLRGLKKRKTEQQFDTALEKRVHAEGHSTPSLGDKRSAIDTYLQDSRAHARARGKSNAVRGAREVAAHRKRQLGRERR
jgi:hypothetical protein